MAVICINNSKNGYDDDVCVFIKMSRKLVEKERKKEGDA